MSEINTDPTIYEQFFYDGQIRRFITQFIRAVSNFQVEFGNNPSGQMTYLRVPVIYGDMSRQVASIINNNSENTLPSVPLMSTYISDLQYDRERVQSPTHISKVSLRTLRYDETAQQYTHQQGDAFTIERMMPVPYKMIMKLDIWTSNTTQKLQIWEQIATLFNPALEIQNTDNYIDWTSLSAVFLTNTTWTSRSIPIGTDNPIDIATLSFELPIWLSAPVKVKKLGVVQKIIASIYDDSGQMLSDEELTGGTLLARKYVTPLGYGVLYIGNTLQLVKPSESVGADGGKIGTKDLWRPLIDLYGTLKDGTTEIRLMQSNGTEIIGTVAYNPLDDSQLIFTPHVDTLPANTLSPVNAIIDPLNVNINQNNITTPTTGTRYLILNDIGTDGDSGAHTGVTPVWPGAGSTYLVAKANDIIEFNGTYWFVSFDSLDSVAAQEVQYVTNLTTGTQYKWLNHEWTKSYEGLYREGLWSIFI